MNRYSEYPRYRLPNIYKHEHKPLLHPTTVFPNTIQGERSLHADLKGNIFKKVHDPGRCECKSASNMRSSVSAILPWRHSSQAGESKWPDQFRESVGELFEVDKSRNMGNSCKCLSAHAPKTTLWHGVGNFSTIGKWHYNTYQLCAGASSLHNHVVAVHDEAKKSIQETSKEQVRRNVDTTQDLSSRIQEVHQWIQKLRKELEENIAQGHALSALKQKVQVALKNVEEPLEVSKEVQLRRNARQGIELVQDAVQQSLHKENSVFERSHTLLSQDIVRLDEQLKKLRIARHEIELDLQKKVQAKDTDEFASNLSQINRELGRVETTSQFGFHSSPPVWLNYTQNLLDKSENERNLSVMLSKDVCTELVQVTNDCAFAWYSTNSALKTRISEINDAQIKTEGSIRKLDHDITTTRNDIDDVENALRAKIPSLQLATSRLEKRKERPGFELCRDQAMVSLLQEVNVLQTAVQTLRSKLAELKSTLAVLLQAKASLEQDLKLKNLALAVDREKCLGLRLSRPIAPSTLIPDSTVSTPYRNNQQDKLW